MNRDGAVGLFELCEATNGSQHCAQKTKIGEIPHSLVGPRRHTTHLGQLQSL